MSTIAERAAAEADAVEAAEAAEAAAAELGATAEPAEGALVDDGDAAALELEDERADAAERERANNEPPSDRAAEKVAKTLENEDTRHRKRIAEILGDEMADLAPCPLCVIDGFVLSQAPPDFDPLQRLAVLTAIGDTAEPTLKAHPTYYRCDTCDGNGDVLSGARKQTTRTRECPDCGGLGYRDRVQDQARVDAGIGAPVMPAELAGATPPAGPADQWLRPFGHPHWGQPPAAVGVIPT